MLCLNHLLKTCQSYFSALFLGPQNFSILLPPLTSLLMSFSQISCLPHPDTLCLLDNQISLLPNSCAAAHFALTLEKSAAATVSLQSIAGVS